MAINAPVIAFRSIRRGTLPGWSLFFPILSFLASLYTAIFISVYSAMAVSIAVSNVRRIVPDIECNSVEHQHTVFAVTLPEVANSLAAPVNSGGHCRDTFCRCCGFQIRIDPSARITTSFSNSDNPTAIATHTWIHCPDESVYCYECSFHYGRFGCHCSQCGGCIRGRNYSAPHRNNHFECDCSVIDIFSDRAADQSADNDEFYNDIVGELAALSLGTSNQQAAQR